MTIRDAINTASLSIARRDAETLLLHRLGRERAWLLAHDDEILSVADTSAFRTMVSRRALQEPLQYITGTQEFYGLVMRVTPDTLIPRPETEHLVEAVELWAMKQDASRVLRMVDVGTGTGAIAIALATRLGGLEMVAVDVSEAALLVALENAQVHECLQRISFLRNDLLEGFEAESFDVVVSNPPYVPAGDAAGMQPEVVLHEPHLALFAGGDGMDIYRRLLPQAYAVLRVGGLLAIEFGYGQRAAMEELLAGWSGCEYIKDLQGIDRVVVAQR